MRARTNALVCASLHGTLSFFLCRVVSFSTRRSQSVKLGYVCSLWHARSESLGNRTLISFFFPSFLVSFFSFFPSRFPLSLSRQLPAIRSPQGKLVFSIARRRAGTKTRGYSQPSRSSLFSKQEPRLYSRGMQVHRLIAKEEQFVDPSPALNCFGFSLNRSRVTLSNFAARPKSVPLSRNYPIEIRAREWSHIIRLLLHILKVVDRVDALYFLQLSSHLITQSSLTIFVAVIFYDQQEGDRTTLQKRFLHFHSLLRHPQNRHRKWYS